MEFGLAEGIVSAQFIAVVIYLYKIDRRVVIVETTMKLIEKHLKIGN